ncbi:hypothetical protein WN48_07627 [Eufriesea mexicana]|uniref:Uncharacterized protein n=1 Tax=Eufriesea mexicana TaxID=516756 RepID=A0A310SN45_9HYME|nr:hypothetical protein WN48_07627 [Eufriesea mexicana]
MCAMYYYASKLTAAALSGGGSFAGGGGAAGGGGGSAVCRCHETHREQQQQQQSPKRSQQQPPQTARHQPRSARVNTPTRGPTTSEHVVVEHPRPNHYHRHRTKHKGFSPTYIQVRYSRKRGSSTYTELPKFPRERLTGLKYWGCVLASTSFGDGGCLNNLGPCAYRLMGDLLVLAKGYPSGD